MRLALLFVSLAVLSVRAAGPEITARVSKQDLNDIIAAIRAATREPILDIAPSYSPTKVPGAIPRKTYDLGPIQNGKVQMKPAVTYERTDQVSVSTGYRQNLTGGAYEVRRIGKTWKIVFRSFWIH